MGVLFIQIIYYLCSENDNAGLWGESKKKGDGRRGVVKVEGCFMAWGKRGEDRVSDADIRRFVMR